MKTALQLAQMSQAAYERYLKRNGFTGLAAARMDKKRREGRAQQVEERQADDSSSSAGYGGWGHDE